MSTYQDERELVGNIFATSWTACPVAYPDHDFTPPLPTTDPANPSSFILFEVSYSEAELIAMGGMSKVEGTVEVSVWVEKDMGDAVIRSHIEALRTLFKSADTSDMWFLELQPFNYEMRGEWYGRLVGIPFIRIRP